MSDGITEDQGEKIIDILREILYGIESLRKEFQSVERLCQMLDNLQGIEENTSKTLDSLKDVAAEVHRIRMND